MCRKQGISATAQKHGEGRLWNARLPDARSPGISAYCCQRPRPGPRGLSADARSRRLIAPHVTLSAGSARVPSGSRHRSAPFTPGTPSRTWRKPSRRGS